MSLPLLRKEVREHGVVVLLILLLGSLLLWAALRNGDRMGGRFAGLSFFVSIYAPLLALTLSNRLFAVEYSGRTQLFLEVLPVSRARVFVTKWLLGGGLTLGTMALCWLITYQAAREREELALTAALLTLGCLTLFTLTLWAFAAMAGMLGRYRYIIWITGALAIVIASNVTGIPSLDLPVLRMLGQDVAMARAELTALDVLVPLGIIGVCIVGAATLALYGSGGIASTLARRMTAREVAFVAISFAVVMVTVSTLESKPVKPLFALTSGEPVRGKHASASVLPTGDLDETAARDLAAVIVADVDSLIDALALPTRTSIFVTPQQGLDPYVMQRAALDASDGIVLRAAADAPQDYLRGLVLHSLLLDHTRLRAHREDRHVLLDGLSAYWVLQDDPAARERWWLRAASVPKDLDARDLSNWSTTVEELGDCISFAAAFGALDVMATELGRERLLQLMREVFAQPPDDVRALFERSPNTILASAGLSWSSVATKLAAARAAVRARHPALTAREPITAEVTWRDDRQRGMLIETSVRGTDTYRVLYAQINPWASDIGDMPRMDVRGAYAVLPISPPRGGRVLAAIEVDDTLLGCPVRVLARRVTLR